MWKIIFLISRDLNTGMYRNRYKPRALNYNMSAQNAHPVQHVIDRAFGSSRTDHQPGNRILRLWPLWLFIGLQQGLGIMSTDTHRVHSCIPPAPRQRFVDDNQPTVFQGRNLRVRGIVVERWRNFLTFHGQHCFDDAAKSRSRFAVSHVRFHGSDQQWFGTVLAIHFSDGVQFLGVTQLKCWRKYNLSLNNVITPRWLKHLAVLF